MPTPTKFTADGLLDAAGRVLGREGLAGLSMAAVAREAGAPSGSVYHRFPTRDHLVAALWLRAVEGFQAAYLAALGQDGLDEAVAAAVGFVVEWVASHPAETRLLLQHRREDLIDGDWPDPLRAAASALAERFDAGVAAFADRLRDAGCDADPATVVFALVEVPSAAALLALRGGGDVAARALPAARAALGLPAP